MSASPTPSEPELRALMAELRQWAAELGFQQLGVADTRLSVDADHLARWLDQGRHGEMEYMARNTELRRHPERLVEGTLRIISVRMDYGQADPDTAWSTLHDGNRAYVARYALGRDYHKLMRQRLQKLAERLDARIGSTGYRAFVDSAPVLERAVARKAGLGWVGKHTGLINRHAGSWFFLGELFTTLPLPPDSPTSAHCGTCLRCIEICPTRAIVQPYHLDARRCISYLTIELRGSIPVELRKPIGNRIFGCDDCQLVCPWNKFAKRHDEPDFRARNRLDQARLSELFAWSEEEFLRRTEGSAIRRTGHIGWLRNLAIALGNAPSSEEVITALQSRRTHPSELLREHVDWALRQHQTDA